ncbi:MAG: PAS domain S-box protein [Thermodesulfobacteriota bacterium]
MRPERVNVPQRWLIVTTGLTLLALLAGGSWFYRVQEQRLRQSAMEDLQAVAELKVRQIVQWRFERMMDAAVLVESPFLAEAVTRWLSDPQPDLAARILDRFRVVHLHLHCVDVMLTDAGGKVRLSLADRFSSVPEHAEEAVRQAFRQRRPVMTDLHTGPGGLPPHVDVVAPFFPPDGTEDRPSGAIILQIDAQEFLYPLIQLWPTSSRTAETLLVKRDGDSVLFLNELRHRKATALTFRIPLTETEVPAVMVVSGKEGIVRGKDYRGVPVFAVLKPVPDTGWFMVSKVDEAEALAGWELWSFLIVALFFALMISSIAVGGLIWQRNAKAGFRKLYVAEAALRSFHERYRVTLLSVGDGVITTDSQGRVELLNETAQSLTGWAQEEAIGKPLDEVFRIISEETRLPVENPAVRVMREGLVVGLANHTLLVARDGTERPVADSGAPIRDEHGVITGVVLVFRDQTEEREARKALEASEERYRDLYENSPDMMLSINAESGRIVRCNETCARTTGFRKEQIVGRHILDMYHQDCIEDARRSFQAFQETGVADNAQLQVVCADGSLLDVMLNLKAVRDERGRIRLGRCSWRDITDLKKAQEALKESEERYRAVFEQASDAILIIRPGGETLHANAAALELLQATKEQIVGRNIIDFYWEPSDRVRFREAIDGNGFVKGFEWAVRRADGSRRDCELNSTILADSDGHAVAYLSMIRDLTDAKLLERQLIMAQKMEAVGTLAGGVAHDFNNLLQVVLGYTELILADERFPAEYRDDLAKVRQAAGNGAELVHRLLTFSRKTEFRPRPVNLNLRIEQVRTMLSRTIPKMIHIELMLSDDIDLINADPTQMEQVLMNLAVNARDAMPQGGRLSIETKNVTLEDDYSRTHLGALPGRYVMLSVSDTGTGIDKDTLQHIFEPFYTTKGPGEGTGLGLAMVYGIVKQHGGYIMCYSAPSVGTTFRLYFPVVSRP